MELNKPNRRERAYLPDAKVFTVEWDAARGKYVALNENRDLLGVSTDKNIAIGSAVRDANLASRAGVKVIVIVGTNGQYHEEYVAQPPVVR